MWSSKSKIWSAAGLIFIGVVAGLIFATNFDWTPEGLATRKEAPGKPEAAAEAAPEAEPVQAVQGGFETSKAFTAVAKSVLPTVVSISTEKMVRTQSRDESFWFFRDFFDRNQGDRQPEVQRQTGLGSGVIVSSDGYILTNNHVIEDVDDIDVTLYDNRTYSAELIGNDPLTEVAVIKIEAEELPVARLGDSDALEIGEWILAIGNPLYLYSTVTAGIVSAKGRALGLIQDQNAARTGGSYAIENFIQTDAAINRGNSGGAMVNLRGEVVGINTAIASQTGFYTGYGFAVPINLAKKIMDDLIDKGYVARAWLGISMRNEPMRQEVAERFGLDRPRGVIIDSVMDDSPAGEAGLEPLDIILEIDGRSVNQSNEVQNLIALKDPRETVTLTVLRDRRERDIRVRLGQRETGRDTGSQTDEDQVTGLGIEVETLTDEIAGRLGAYENDTGVLVTRVEPYSAAADAGFRRFDLIIRIEDEVIRNESDYRRVLRRLEKGKVAIFQVKRGNTESHLFPKIPD